MLHFFCTVPLCLVTLFGALQAETFTVSSYHCGGHDDYIRAVCMQKLMQERYNAEPETMVQLDRVQRTALKALFSPSVLERMDADVDWYFGDYRQIFDKITADPKEEDSINKSWCDLSLQMVTPYQERPVVIYDDEVYAMLLDHLQDLTKGEGTAPEGNGFLSGWLEIARRVMVERIFRHQLKHDIIALQEANDLNPSLFPKHYAVHLEEREHSVNGVAWNKERFSFVERIGSVGGSGVAILLSDLQSGRRVAIASGHLSGCNPFRAVADPETGELDSAQGDRELEALLALLEECDAETKIIAMDSNVTAAHPRLLLLKESDYTLDYKNYLEPTCTHPGYILDTRMDWIAMKSADASATISNIPVMGVGLNSLQTNVSDHKPVAARIDG